MRNSSDPISNPQDPYYYHTWTDNLPTEVCYRIEPSKKNIVTESIDQIKKKGFQRRFIYNYSNRGWDNWTQFEKDKVKEVKDIVLKENGIDLSIIKDFGPCTDDYQWHPGTMEIINGVDILYDDSIILRYLAAREFDVQRVIKELIPNLEFRQTSMPVPRLTEKITNLLNKGLFYVHGRTRDLSPIIVLDLKRLKEFLDNKELDNKLYVHLHNYISNYITYNCLVHGQVERWVIYLNINQFSLWDLPKNLFREAANELQTSYIDWSQKIYVVNLTKMQNMAAKLLMVFLDKQTCEKLFFSNRMDDPDLLQFLDPSQLEKKHGGTAPDVTRYWPPTFPEYHDFDHTRAPCIVHPREKYNELHKANPTLELMPRHMREDLPPLPQDIAAQKLIEQKNRQKQEEERKKQAIIRQSAVEEVKIQKSSKNNQNQPAVIVPKINNFDKYDWDIYDEAQVNVVPER